MGKSGRIICLCGKMSSGKDTIKNNIMNNYNIYSLVSYTDRPKRNGETEGKEYFFKTKEQFQEIIDKNMLIEYREYHTKIDNVDDTWRYGLGKLKLSKDKNYVTIMDFNGAKSLVDYYGDKVKIYYIDVPLRIRKKRCIERGDYNKYEFARRKKQDNKDFAKKVKLELNVKSVKNKKESIDNIARYIIEDFYNNI